MSVTLDVVLFSYQSRAIFDVYLGKTDIGVAGPWPDGSGGGSIVGVQIPVGPLKMTWRYADTGQTVMAKNTPTLAAPPKEAAFLAVHVYDDNTVELIPSQHYPTLSKRGEAYNEQWKKRNGK